MAYKVSLLSCMYANNIHEDKNERVAVAKLQLITAMGKARMGRQSLGSCLGWPSLPPQTDDFVE